MFKLFRRNYAELAIGSYSNHILSVTNHNPSSSSSALNNAIECMNRNKRRLTPANHGKHYNNYEVCTALHITFSSFPANFCISMRV
jgi:hypothetical protein